jgi:hypothetical protein
MKNALAALYIALMRSKLLDIRFFVCVEFNNPKNTYVHVAVHMASNFSAKTFDLFSGAK